jgi:hypothetical protein
MRGLIAALTLCVLCLSIPGVALAQDYVEAVCGDHFQVTGSAALRDRKARENAIAAYNEAARAKYGQKTGFTFEAGQRMGRVKLVCQGAGGGRTACLASGRACVWRPTTVPNTSVMAQCEEGYLMFASGNISSCTDYFFDDIVLNFKPVCPKGYSLEPNPGRVPRCLRD